MNSCLNSICNHGTVSKSTLCEELGISITSINSTLRSLSEQGYVICGGIGASSGGRKPELLSINPDGAFFAGIEFSADGISCVILNLKREICYKHFAEVGKEADAEDLIRYIILELKKAEGFLKERRDRLCGIAVGASGYLDYEKGMLIFYSQRPAWNNIYLIDRIKKELDYPVFLLNNVDAMPYAYKWVSCGGTCEDHVMMAVRYGFKISAFANNQRIRGAHDFTGEIGHMHVAGSNRLCRCGKHGCFDTEVTYTAIGQKIEEGMRVGRFKQLAKAIKERGGFSIELFTDACNNGDQEALELMEETVMNICSALSWIYYMIDPAVIMVSSKLDKYVDFYKLISGTLYKRYENNFTYGKLKIEPAPFGEYLGAVGAAAYIYEKKFGQCNITVGQRD